jgi:hypothetical protein
MGYRPEEKVQVKLEFLRMLTKMRLDPARMTLLTGFFETYLQLTKNEEEILETELHKLPVEEARKMRVKNRDAGLHSGIIKKLRCQKQSFTTEFSLTRQVRK